MTFEEETPSLAEMTHRWEIIRENNQPFLVCEIDDIIAGYAYATSFRSRVAYRHTVEESVYVDGKFQGKGIGKALLSALIECCKKIQVRCVVAIVGNDNPVSINLHHQLGFTDVGTLHDVGFKNGNWIDRFIMEYIITSYK